MVSSNVEEVDHDLADRLRLSLAFRFIEITVNLFSLFSSETSAKALPPVITYGVAGDLVGVLQVELVHHYCYFLN